MCGQKPAKNNLGLIATYIPFLSDNIMVDNDGHAWLTDNILIDSQAKTPRRILKRIIKKILHQIPKISVKTAMFIKTMYDNFK